MAEKQDTVEGMISPDDMVESVQSRPPPIRPPGVGGPRSAKTDARVGTILDERFTIKRLIARGGMGKIYEAIQEPLGRRVALKVMDLGYAEDLDPDFQKRFFLEAATCARLSHPNTIRVFDYGHSEEDDTYYIVMEYIEGATLLELIDRLAPLDPLRVVHIARQICASLHEAHGQGVIHRDLKPSNVLLTRHGEQEDFAKVLDFGLVKLVREDAEEMTKSGLFLGSPNYMSPEQIRSNNIDQRADLYSLGVILYMALTGMSPFKRNSSVNVLLAQLEDEPPPFHTTAAADSVPPCMEWVVMTCLAKDPDRRFASVGELNRALKVCSAVITGRVAPPTMNLVRGRLDVPTEVDVAISTVRFPGTGPISGPTPAPASRPVQPPDPIPSTGSIVSQRLRPDGQSAPMEQASGSRPRSGIRRRQPKSAVDRLLTSPLFAMFLGAMVVVLLLALIFLSIRLLSNGAADRSAGEPAPTAAPGPVDPSPDRPIDGDLPELDALDVTPAPAREPTPATVRTTPRATPAVARPTPAPRSTPEPTPSTTPAPTPEPTAEPTPEPSPEPTKVRGDLRDPWAD